MGGLRELVRLCPLRTDAMGLIKIKGVSYVAVMNSRFIFKFKLFGFTSTLRV